LRENLRDSGGKKGKAYLWGLVETSECVETKVRE